MPISRKLTAVTAATTAVGLPVANAVAATTQARAGTTAEQSAVTVSKTVTGQLEQVDRWGEVQVVVSYTKTTRTVNGKKKVAIKLTKVNVPVYPNHTDRSSYISSQALPLLEQEVVQLQPASSLKTFQLVSNATDTSYAFVQSLQSALIAIGE